MRWFHTVLTHSGMDGHVIGKGKIKEVENQLGYVKGETGLGTAFVCFGGVLVNACICDCIS